MSDQQTRLKAKRRDGKAVWILVCPGCGVRGEIDDDQFFGRVSTDCPRCSFHETVDWSKRTTEQVRSDTDE